MVRGLKWYSPLSAEAMDNPSSAEPAPEQPPETSARAQLAAEKKRKIMEAMALQQRNFLRKHRDELNSIPSMAGSPTESDRSACTRTQTDSSTSLLPHCTQVYVRACVYCSLKSIGILCMPVVQLAGCVCSRCMYWRIAALQEQALINTVNSRLSEPHWSNATNILFR